MPDGRRFASEVLDRFEREPEVEIETTGGGGAPHTAVIWIVVDGEDVFVRSYLGTRGRWYQNVTAREEAFIHAGGRPIAVRALPATDPHSIARCSRGFERKYAGDPSTPAMLAGAVLGTTLRLEPTGSDDVSDHEKEP